MTRGPLPLKPGPPSAADLFGRIDHALRHLGDRIELNRNPLTRLAAVSDLAAARYAGRLHPRALALREVVSKAVSDVSTELAHDEGLGRVREFLTLYASGSNVAAAAKLIGISREHCSRSVKHTAVLLVCERFVQLTLERRRAEAPRLPAVLRAS